jgi:beta-aspartyl-peptidase (threonine type)
VNEVARRHQSPALIVHGGAGERAARDERPGRRRGLLAAVAAGATLLRDGAHALDAVTAAVTTLENDPLFNAGYGSCLTSDGRVEMDAGIAVADFAAGMARSNCQFRTGGVVMISRTRNPILLARAVMERTPHLLMGGSGAELLARAVGLRLCERSALIAPRALARWRASRRESAEADHGTVGAVALDSAGNLAAGTSTGGLAGKMPGRIGDTALLGAGFYASGDGAASATGTGEAIVRAALCREGVVQLARWPAREAAERVIAQMNRRGGEAGIIIADARGTFGAAHNAAAMEIATFDPVRGLHHSLAPQISRSRRPE